MEKKMGTNEIIADYSANVNARLFAVYDKIGKVVDVYIEAYNAFEAARKLNLQMFTNKYYVDLAPVTNNPINQTKEGYKKELINRQ
jgi:hypothetical protein